MNYLRKNTASVISRHTASSLNFERYTAFNSALPEFFSPKEIVVIQCNKCLKIGPLTGHYVKKGKQNIPTEQLTIGDMRKQCIECFDKTVKAAKLRRIKNG